MPVCKGGDVDTDMNCCFACLGAVVSTKREELAYILEHFNIQVDNPMAILNQDTSRNFLHSKSPNDKYRVGHLQSKKKYKKTRQVLI